MPEELQTVTIEGVEVLSTGGPVHGVGSPPEGDRYTTKDLGAMAAAAQELEANGEWRVAAKIGEEPLGRTKIGHDSKQRLASTVTGGEMPAVGWLTNQRVSDDGTKLLADITDVPAKLAQLVKAKAYRTRSAELSRVTSQKTGKVHDWVVSGMSWLGGKMPAVRTLDDVVTLYEGDDAERRFVMYEDVEEPALDELRDAVAGLGVAYADASSVSKPTRADTRPMPDTKYSDDQRKKFAEATGLEEAKVTDEMLAGAGVLTETEEPKPDDDDKGKQLELGSEALRSLESKLNTESDERKKLEKRLYEQERDTFLENDAIKTGKIKPGEREFVQVMYDADPETARKYVAQLPVNDDLVKEYGSDEETDEAKIEAKRELEENEYAVYAGAHLGLEKEELI